MNISDVYQRRFEARPRLGSQFPDLHTFQEYEFEVVGRWNRLAEFLVKRAQIIKQGRAPGPGNLGVYLNIGTIDGEPYQLAQFKDIHHVLIPTIGGLHLELDPEFEVLFRTNNRPLIAAAQEIMEGNAPDFLLLRDVKRLYLDTESVEPSLRVMEEIFYRGKG